MAEEIKNYSYGDEEILIETIEYKNHEETPDKSSQPIDLDLFDKGSSGDHVRELKTSGEFEYALFFWLGVMALAVAIFLAVFISSVFNSSIAGWISFFIIISIAMLINKWHDFE